jgi:hypothetical protein
MRAVKTRASVDPIDCSHFLANGRMQKQHDRPGDKSGRHSQQKVASRRTGEYFLQPAIKLFHGTCLIRVQLARPVACSGELSQFRYLGPSEVK